MKILFREIAQLTPDKKVTVKRQENKYNVKMTRRKTVIFCYRQQVYFNRSWLPMQAHGISF